MTQRSRKRQEGPGKGHFSKDHDELTLPGWPQISYSGKKSLPILIIFPTRVQSSELWLSPHHML